MPVRKGTAQPRGLASNTRAQAHKHTQPACGRTQSDAQKENVGEPSVEGVVDAPCHRNCAPDTGERERHRLEGNHRRGEVLSAGVDILVCHLHLHRALAAI